MTRGERLVQSLPLKTSFYDAHERRAYSRMIEVASRILDDASLIERGRAFLARFVREDVRQRRGYETWIELLDYTPEHIVRELLSDTPRGEALRETAPVFTVIDRPRASEDRKRNA